MQTPRQPRQSLIPTPGRPGHSNLPTPTASNSSRRSRMSLGVSSRTEAEERDAAFHDAMRKMPPSSLLRASTMGLTRDETPERQLSDDGIHPLSYSTPTTSHENGSTIPTPASGASARKYTNLGISQTGTPASNRLAPNQPRTPSGMQLRPRVPSSRVAQPTTTPSRIVSGSVRSSTYQGLGYPSSAVTPKRRVSNLGTNSARTPARPESRQAGLPRTPGVLAAEGEKASAVPSDWAPEVGTAVRINSMGFEGIIRWIGKIEGKDGTFAGVELDRGFVGMGKNNGTFQEKRYFFCEEKGGVFALLNKLTPPEERPASVASWHSASSVGSSMNGRATPAFSIQSGRETPFISEDGEEPEEQNASSTRTVVAGPGPLTRSTRANLQASTAARTPSKFTVGSRASALAGKNAKQLAAQKALQATDGSLADPPPRASTPNTPGAHLGRSMIGASTSNSSVTSTTTPKPLHRARQSLSGIATPSRNVSMSASVFRTKARESLGGASAGGFATPKAPMSSRNGRMSAASGRASVTSNAHDPMPPPASPTKFSGLGRSTAATTVQAAAIKEAQAEVESMKETNRVLVDKLNAFEAQNSDLQKRLNGENAAPSSVDERVELESKLKEAQKQVHEYKIASEFQSREVTNARIKIESLEKRLVESDTNVINTSQQVQDTQARLARAEGTIAKLTRDLEVEKQRLEEEFDKGMQAKREEVRNAEDTVKDLRKQLSVVEMVKAEIVNDASQMTAIYEAKLSEAKSRRFDLEKTVRSLEDQLLEAQERRNQAALLPAEALKEADTAAMIDNENLKAQVAHQQKKIVSLEDQNEELQVQIEKYDEAAIKANEKARDNERRLKEEIANGRSEISSLREQINKHKDRVAELAHALKDQGHTLASAQAEIESNRVDLADLETMRVAQTMLNRAQKEKTVLQQELEAAKAEGQEVDTLKLKLAQLQNELAELSTKHEDLRTKHALALPTIELNHKRETTSSTLSATSTNAEKSIAGFQKIVAELTDENGDLKQRIQDLEAEMQTLLADNQQLAAECGILRESLTQLEAAVEDKLAKEEEQLNASDIDGAQALKASDDRTRLELERMKSKLCDMESEKIAIERKFASLKDEQEHELRELESLIEAKIYREDELERQIELLKREAERPGTALSHTSSTQRNDFYPGNASHSRASSIASNHTSGSTQACPLCHGDHLIEACPVFTNEEVDDSPDKRSPSLSRGELLARRKSGLSMEQVYCDNCETKDHRTADCPMADDVF